MPFEFPLNFRFRLISLTARIDVTDSTGREVLFLKQKGFKMREDIDVWRDEAKTTRAYRLQADRIIDFRASYTITGPNGETLGAVKRQGARSIWKASYDVVDANGEPVAHIHEENPWLKVLDAFLGNIPFVSMFINPAYLVTVNGQDVMRIKKEPAFFEGKFTLDTREKVDERTQDLVVPSLLMMLILERARG